MWTESEQDQRVLHCVLFRYRLFSSGSHIYTSCDYSPTFSEIGSTAHARELKNCLNLDGLPFNESQEVCKSSFLDIFFDVPSGREIIHPMVLVQWYSSRKILVEIAF